MEDEDLEEIEENLEMDYQLGQDLKDRVCAVRFTHI